MRARSKISEWLHTRAWLQLTALLIAIVAWLFVNSGRNISERRSVKLQYMQMPKGLVFQRAPLKQAMVTLVGPIHKLRAIKEDDLVYLVDLSSARSGVQRVELESESFRLPVEVEVAQINPRSWYVHLEEVFSKTIPLKPNLIGTAAEGHSVRKIRFSPSSVVVQGPKSVVSKINEVPVDIPLQNRSESFSLNLTPKINLPDSEVREPVNVDVEIGMPRLQKELDQVQVVAIGAAEKKVHITPPAARLIVELTQENSFKALDLLKVKVNTEGLNRGSYRLRGQVELPPGSRLLKMEPENFLVEVLP